MGFLDDYGAAVGAPQQKPEQAPKSFLEEYDAARPASIAEGAQQIAAKGASGLANTWALGVDWLGIAADALDKLQPEKGLFLGSKKALPELSKQAKRFGEAMRDASAQAFPEIARLREDFLLSQGPEALGSAAGFMLPGGWLQAAGVPAWASTMTLGAMVQGAAQYHDAKLSGADDATAWKAWLAGSALGTSEAIPLSRILARIDKGAGGGLKRALVDMLIEGGEEFVQESGSQLASNLIASHLLEYDKDRKAFEDVLANGNAGLFSGVILSALGTVAAHGKPVRTVADIGPETAPKSPEPVTVPVDETTAEKGRPLPEVPAGEPAVQDGGGPVLPGPQEGVRPGVPPEAAPGGEAQAQPQNVVQQLDQVPAEPAGPLPGVPGDQGGGVSPGPGGASGTGSQAADVPVEGGAQAGGVGLQGAPQAEGALPKVEGEPVPPRPGDVYKHGTDAAANFPGVEDKHSELAPVAPVKIADLRLTQLENFRQGVDEPRVEKLMDAMRAGKELPPVTAIRSPRGELRVLDGHHRVVAAKRLGYDSVPVRELVARKKPEAKPPKPETKPPASEREPFREADLADAARKLITHWKDPSASIEEELPAAIQLADRVLASRRDVGIKETHLDRALERLVRESRKSPQEPGSAEERADTRAMMLALRGAEAAIKLSEEMPPRDRRREGDKPVPTEAVGAAAYDTARERQILEELRPIERQIEKLGRPSAGQNPDFVPPPISAGLRGQKTKRITELEARRAALLQELRALYAPAAKAQAEPPAQPEGRRKVGSAWDRLEAPKSLRTGGEADIELATGKTIPAKYGLMEADELIPSHDARRGYARNANGDINERDYQDPVEGRPFRDTVEKVARDPRRRILLSDTPTPTDGPPIVTSKGVVLGGNARAMGMQLSYQRGIPQQIDFGGAVLQVAKQRGIEVPHPVRYRHPVLVRVIAEGSEGAPGELSRVLNESLTTAKGATTEAVSRGAKVTPDAASQIADALGGGTLREALADAGRAQTILRALVSSGAFTQGDLVELTDPNRGIPTAAGKQVIEDALLGAVITDVRVLSETPPATRNALLKSLPSLVRIKAHHPAIAQAITSAAQGMATLRESNQPLEDAIRQQVLPGVDVGWKTDRLALGIMRSLLDETPTKTAAHFAEAASRIEDFMGVQSSLFGDEQLAPQQRLEREFGVTPLELSGAVEEDGDIEEDGSDGSIAMSPGELPPDLQLGRPVDPIAGGGANLNTPIGDGMKGRLEPPPKPGPLVSQPDIINALSKVVEVVGGKTPIRWGRLGTRKALGIFKVGPETIRVKKANDVPTAAHEVGHALEKHVFGWNKGGPWVKPRVDRAQQADLVRLGKALYGDTKPAGGYKREGFAEYIRLYTTEPEMAPLAAPKFHPWFEVTFLDDKPEVRKALLEVRRLTDRWREQGSVGRLEASVIEPTGAKAKLRAARAKVTREWMVETFVEAGRPLNEIAREAERRMGRLLDPKDDPFMVFQALRSTHSARIRHMVESGMVNLAGEVVGPALSQIRPLVGAKYREFMLYMLARRGIALLTDPKRGPREPGMSLADAREVVKELGSPELERAASLVYEWNDGVLSYAAQASPTLAQAVTAIREADPGSYVPLQREFDELDALWGEMKRSRGMGSGGSIAQRLKGSGRRIKNPFPVLIANAERTLLAAHRRMVLDSVIRLSRIEGLGHLVEEVPVDRVPVAEASVEQILERLRQKAGIGKTEGGIELKGTGFAEELDLSGLSGEVLTFFAPAQMPKGQDPIIPVWSGDRVRWFQVNHRVASMLAGMDVYRLPQVLDLVLGMPARMFRMGTTGLRAAFTLVTNPARDFQTLYQNTQSSAWGGRILFEWIQNLAVAGIHHATGGRLSTPYLDAFLRLGAEMAQPLQQDSYASARVARRLFQGRVVRVIDPRNVLDFVRDILQAPETATRVTELKMLAKEVGWQPGQPMSLDQSLRLLLGAKQVTVDFTAAGNFGRVMNQIAPFHNAPIQGTRASVRAARRAPGRWTFRGLQITAATLALWWYNKDKDWYRELPARVRALYWAIPFTWDGREELALIPRAQEGPFLFGSIPEALADAWYQSDPAGARAAFGAVFDSMAPNVVPVIPGEIYEQARNRDTFWDMPIVPQGELSRPAYQQAGEYTSRVAKFLGKLFNVSPRRIDHGIRAIGGGVSGDLIEAVGLGGKSGKVGEPSDAPVLGRLFQRGGALGTRPASVQKLYDRFEESTILQRTIGHDETVQEQNVRLMLSDASRAVSALSAVRSMSDSVDERRQITAEMVAIARQALEDAAAGDAVRGPMQQERKQAERREKELKR